MVLFTAALLVRAVVGSAFPGPAYPDSYYYVHVGQNLASGLGFTVDYLWNLDDMGAGLSAASTLPLHANALWMPLAEVIQVPFVWLLGSTNLAASLPFWLIGAAPAPLTWWIGRDAGLGTQASLTAGLMVAVPGGLTPFMSQPDNFGLFMFLGALSLWLCSRGARGDRRAFALGGLVVGLATLTRSDGILLGVPFALVALAALVRGRERRSVLIAATVCVALFAVVVGPWLYRQVEVFGSLFPSAASGRLVWLTDYQQLFSFSALPTPASWLAQGSGAILASRIGALLAALGLFALLPLLVVLAPFALIGLWAKRADVAFRPFVIYGALLFAVMTLFFSVLVPHGTFIHAAAALVPHSFLLVVVGIGTAIRWIATRRPSWNVATATNAFGFGAVAVAVLGGAIQSATTLGHWSANRQIQSQLTEPLTAVATDDRVMSADPGAVSYLTGHPGIVTPSDPIEQVEEAMRAYDIRWLVLQRTAIVPALLPVLNGDVQPSWLSAPVAFESSPARTTASTAALESGAVDGALYAVCLTPADTRCAR